MLGSGWGGEGGGLGAGWGLGGGGYSHESWLSFHGESFTLLQHIAGETGVAQLCESFTYFSPSFAGDPWSCWSDPLSATLLEQRCILKSQVPLRAENRARTGQEGAAASGQEGAGELMERGASSRFHRQLPPHAFLPGNDLHPILGSVSNARPPSLLHDFSKNQIDVSHPRPVDGNFVPADCFYGKTWIVDLKRPQRLESISVLYPAGAQELMAAAGSSLPEGSWHTWQYQVFLDPDDSFYGDPRVGAGRQCNPSNVFTVSPSAQAHLFTCINDVFVASKILFVGDLRLCQVEVFPPAELLSLDGKTRSENEDTFARALLELQRHARPLHSLPPFPACEEWLIARGSFWPLHSDQISMAREDCEGSSRGHYHYFDTYLLVNNDMSFNVGVCFPRAFQATDPLGENYCRVDEILAKYFPEVGAKVGPFWMILVP